MTLTAANRRAFLRSALTVAGTTAAAPYWFTAGSLGAEESEAKNDRLQMALIGCGGRGRMVAESAGRLARIVAVCDVDREQAETAQAGFPDKPDIYKDYCELLQRDDVDAVINATPDHWHTLINIAACKSGKDVYAEKPLTFTIEEGKLLRKVVHETERVVQVGTQQRSDAIFQIAVELVRNGRLGRLKQIWVASPYYSTKGGPFPKEPIPSGLDWNMYQGQAPERDYCRQRTRGTFRWWYEYSGGGVTDWGNHHLDVAHWGMDCEFTGPATVEARGIFPNGNDPMSFNTADRFFSRMQYPNGLELLQFSALGDRKLYGDVKAHEAMTPEEVDRLVGKDTPEEIKTFNRDGIMFIGDEGRIFVNRGGVYGRPFEELKKNPLPDDRWRVPPSKDHMANFVQCIKTRQEPISPVRLQHRTISACHLTNISMRLGRKIQWNGQTEQIMGDDEANGWQQREQRSPYEI